MCKKSSRRCCNEFNEEKWLAQFKKLGNEIERKVFVSSLVDCETAMRKKTKKMRRGVSY